MRVIRDDLKLLELKKTSLKEKAEMQARFIEDVTKRGEEHIDEKREDIKTKMFSKNELSQENIEVLTEIEALTARLEELNDAGDKLRKLGGLRGKIQQKISTLTKNHKFFSDNTSCPTCTQDIDEDLKSKKIDELTKDAKKLKKGFKELEETIAAEEARENEFTEASKELLVLNKKVSTNNINSINFEKSITRLEGEIESIRDSINSQTESKAELKNMVSKLKESSDGISNLKEEMSNHQFVSSYLKMVVLRPALLKSIFHSLISTSINTYK